MKKYIPLIRYRNNIPANICSYFEQHTVSNMPTSYVIIGATGEALSQQSTGQYVHLLCDIWDGQIFVTLAISSLRSSLNQDR